MFSCRRRSNLGWLLAALVAVTAVPLAKRAARAQDVWDESTQAGAKASQDGRHAEAEEHFKAALREAEKPGAKGERLALSLRNLAELYRDQGRYGEAEPLYRRSLAILEKALGPQHPDVATNLENYAALLRATGRDAEAAEMEARAKAIRAKGIN